MNNTARRQNVVFAVAAAAVLCGTPCPAQTDAAAPPPALERQWGGEVLAQIDADFWLPTRSLYADKAIVSAAADDHAHRQPAFMWGCGVQLSALAEAVDERHPDQRARLIDYGDALQIYWQRDDLGGYDVLPDPKSRDVYYDDNAWIVLAMAQTFERTHEPRFLRRAEDTLKFVLTGEDDQLGGGLYWRESKKESKNTCSNAPTVVGALQLYRLTGKQADLDAATRLYAWTKAHLQDRDGLYGDNISLAGKVDHAKFSYNSALMIRAACLFYQVTGDRGYLAEAQRVAHAASSRWTRPDGSLDDGGRFGHLLLGAFLAVHEEDSDPAWLATVDRTVDFLHAHLRDANGRYPDSWRSAQLTSLDKIELLDEASVAEAYLQAGNAYRPAK